jgi:hypothetical protein
MAQGGRPQANQPAQSGWAGTIGKVVAIIGAITALLAALDAFVNKGESITCEVISSNFSWCTMENRLSFKEAKFFYTSGTKISNVTLRDQLKKQCDGRVYCNIDLGDKLFSGISGLPFMGIDFTYACGSTEPVADYEWAGTIKTVSCPQGNKRP